MTNRIKIDREHLKPLPVGNSGWAEFSQKCYTVDKTLFIKELLDDDTSVALFTRPRRFGKTTAMRMLRAFFEKTPEDTSFLFKPFKIWAAGEKYRAEQGKYPVIYLTFKDHKGRNWEEGFNWLCTTIGSEIVRHKCVFEDTWEDARERELLQRAMLRDASAEELSKTLGILAAALHRHYGEKAVILIDEYDSPVNSASTYGYYDDMIAFMRTFLSGAMKDNEHVKMGIMTGVLRVAKEGVLSGLNNPRVWTVFSGRYAEYFGFTEQEVAEMAAFYGCSSKMPEIKSWYDGYDFGGTEIYNPWSVLNYFDNDCDPKPYWLDTSSNDLITEIVRGLPHDTAKMLESLLSGGRARVTMTQELGPYADIRNRPETLYALLVSAGYLKIVPPASGERLPDKIACVAIPNRELETVFVDDIIDKARRYTGNGESNDIALAVYDRDPTAFRDAIQRFLVQSVSFFDNSESFFHGMTLGFLAVLRNRYKVESNRESGDGRFDISLSPLVKDFPGVIIEVKAAKADSDDLKALAQEARDQIDEKRYDAKMRNEGVTDILKLGLAFYKKNVELVK